MARQACYGRFGQGKAWSGEKCAYRVILNAGKGDHDQNPKVA